MTEEIAATSTDERHHRDGWIRLGLCVIAIGIVWCVVLPRIARVPQMREHTKWLDEQGIDASAMYYTELPVMDSILGRLERSRHNP